MRHGRIHSLAATCGLALSLTALAAEPPAEPAADVVTENTGTTSTETSTPNETSTSETSTQAVTEDVGTPSNPAGRNCWDPSTWGEKNAKDCETFEGQTAEKRCDTADFLLGEQPSDESEQFAAGFFTNRPDPLALRPMYSEELLKRFDTDQNGSLSGQERTTTEVFLEARRASHKQSLTYRFDYDESYDLSAAEKLEARRVCFLEQTEALNVFVERFDADRDGTLCENESMTARLKDRETYYEVAFHEGMSSGFAYRDGPGLPREQAEAFEARSDTLTAEAKASQKEILETVFASDTTATASADIDGEQTGGHDVAEISADFDGEVSGEGPPD